MFQSKNRVVKTLGGAMAFFGAVVMTGALALPSQAEARELTAPYPAVTHITTEAVQPVDYRHPDNRRWTEQERQRYMHRDRYDHNRINNDRYDRQRYDQERRRDRLERQREMNHDRRDYNTDRRRDYKRDANRDFNRNYKRSNYSGESVPYDFRQYGPNHLRRQSRTERLPASPMMEVEGMEGMVTPYTPNYGARGVYNTYNNTYPQGQGYVPTQYRTYPGGQVIRY